MSFERLYGISKTFEMEFERWKIIYWSGTLRGQASGYAKDYFSPSRWAILCLSSADGLWPTWVLICQDDYSSVKFEYTLAKVIKAEIDEVSMDPEDEFDTL